MGIGDEVMVTGHVRELQAHDPRKVRIVYEKGPRWHEIYEGNPRLARPGEQGDFQEYRPRTNWLRPYIEAKKDTRWIWKPYRPPRGEIYLSPKELEFGRARADRIIVQPFVKGGASPNKEWGFERWKAFARMMADAGHPVTQIGGVGWRRLPGVEFIETRTARHVAAVLAFARAGVLQEGGLHHIAAAVGTPAVVIFGGFISPQVTGYDEHRNIFDPHPTYPLGCGWRIPCKHCAAAMAEITPERVFRETEALLEERGRSVAAGLGRAPRQVDDEPQRGGRREAHLPVPQAAGGP